LLALLVQPACRSEQPLREAPTRRPAADDSERSASTRTDVTPPGPDGYGRAGALRYLEVVVGGAAPSQTLPMVVVIHGLGDRPGPHWLDLVQLRGPARVIMPEGPTPYLDGFSWFPFRARGADPKELAAGIGRAAELLSTALAFLERGRPTRGRPIVTGFSQGGMLSFALALRHAERVAFALPISGALPEPLWPRDRATAGAPPIVALHGTDDDLVPFAPTRQLVAHLGTRGYDATLLPYEGVGHQISDAMRQRVSEELRRALDTAPPSP
jgi:phospholipase/carboxylesterase